MNAFEYAIAEAAYEEYRRRRADAGIRSMEPFDDRPIEIQRIWLNVARTVLDRVARYQ